MGVVDLQDSGEVLKRLAARVIVMPGRLDVSPTLRHLAELGIAASAHPAVVGRTLPDEVREQALDGRAVHLQLGYLPTAPMIGCWMSHRQCYSLLAWDLHEFDFLLILEDDVVVSSDFSLDPALLRVLDTTRPAILHLFTRGIALAAPSSQLKVGSRTLFRYVIPPGQTAAYIINRAAAIRALESTAMDGPADWPTWSADVEFWGVFPWPVQESDVPSTIGVVEGGRFGSWIRVASVLSGWAFLGRASFVRQHPKAARNLWARTLISVIMRLRRRLGWPGPEHAGPLLLRRSYRE